MGTHQDYIIIMVGILQETGVLPLITLIIGLFVAWRIFERFTDS